ncbi:MAG TPA: AraC family transcriptional regulator [Puia sp.]|jgi:AraC-like DNA-binding protein|nr:AraC family transcriptional regulator [Puia sp.]
MQIPASIELSHIIRHYLFLNRETQSPCNFRLFSDGNTGIVFSTSGGLTLNAQPLPNAFLYGQISDYKDIFCDTPADLFIIVFRPDAFNRLFNIPADDLKDRILSLTEISETLFHSVLNAATISKKISLAEAFFKKLSPTANPLITASLDYIIKQQGQVTIDQLSGLTGLHPRQLERKFTTVIGLSPKKFSGIARMHGFLKQLRPQKLSLTQCAYESGYYDQAHLIREFRRFTGLTPSQYQKNTAVLATNFLQLSG